VRRSLAVRASCPSGFAPWLTAERQQQAAQVRMLLPDPRFATGYAPLVLAPSARASCAGVELGLLRRAHASTNGRHGCVPESELSRLDARATQGGQGREAEAALPRDYAKARLNFSIAASRSGSSGSIEELVCSFGSVPSNMAQLMMSSPRRERYLMPSSTAPASSEPVSKT
jgi:hypothetical protein